MPPATKLSSMLLVAAAVTLACGGDRPAPAKVVAQAGSDADAAAVESAPAPDGIPRITADQPSHDFGAIKLTDRAEHVFKIRNAGDGVLKIEKVQRT